VPLYSIPNLDTLKTELRENDVDILLNDIDILLRKIGVENSSINLILIIFAPSVIIQLQSITFCLNCQFQVQ
jgi:hypothetical protein